MHPERKGSLEPDISFGRRPPFPISCCPTFLPHNPYQQNLNACLTKLTSTMWRECLTRKHSGEQNKYFLIPFMSRKEAIRIFEDVLVQPCFSQPLIARQESGMQQSRCQPIALALRALLTLFCSVSLPTSLKCADCALTSYPLSSKTCFGPLLSGCYQHN